jgi:hypothetical protein
MVIIMTSRLLKHLREKRALLCSVIVTRYTSVLAREAAINFMVAGWWARPLCIQNYNGQIASAYKIYMLSGLCNLSI